MAPIDHLLNAILVPFEESFHRSIPPIFYPSEDAELIGHLPHTVAEENALNPSRHNDPNSNPLRLLALSHPANPVENPSSCRRIMSKKLAHALIKSKLNDLRVCELEGRENTIVLDKVEETPVINFLKRKLEVIYNQTLFP